MITTILLDLDDTILDFHKAEKEALKKALHKIGVEPTEALLKRYSEINLSQWKLLELGKLTHAEVKINRYRILLLLLQYFSAANNSDSVSVLPASLKYDTLIHSG